MEYTVSDTINSLEDITNVTMSDFDDSFFFMIRLTILDKSIKTFNWQDNPYIAANVYQYDTNGTSKTDEITLSECNREHLLKLAKEDMIDRSFHNTLCFSDKSKVKLSSNALSSADFSNIVISIDHCNNATYNGTCKTPVEIDQFLYTNSI